MATSKKIRSRDEIEQKYKWNLRAMYPDEAEWEKDYKDAEEMAESFTSFSGHLGDSAQALLDAFAARDALWQKVEKVYVYARMKRDEDTRAAKYQAMTARAQSLIAKAGAKTSFFTPELLEMDEELIWISWKKPKCPVFTPKNGIEGNSYLCKVRRKAPSPPMLIMSSASVANFPGTVNPLCCSFLWSNSRISCE